MNVITNDDFAKQMMLLAKPAEKFEPHAYYDADGDCIEFVAKPDSFYAERVDDLVTVYYSQATGELMGSLIKGVSHFLKQTLLKNPGFKIEIEDGGIHLVHLFRAKLWSKAATDENRMQSLIYKKLIEVAEESDVEVDAEMKELCAV